MLGEERGQKPRRGFMKRSNGRTEERGHRDEAEPPPLTDSDIPKRLFQPLCCSHHE